MDGEEIPLLERKFYDLSALMSIGPNALDSTSPVIVKRGNLTAEQLVSERFRQSLRLCDQLKKIKRIVNPDNGDADFSIRITSVLEKKVDPRILEFCVDHSLLVEKIEEDSESIPVDDHVNSKGVNVNGNSNSDEEFGSVSLKEDAETQIIVRDPNLEVHFPFISEDHFIYLNGNKAGHRVVLCPQPDQQKYSGLLQENNSKGWQTITEIPNVSETAYALLHSAEDMSARHFRGTSRGI